MWIGIQQQTWAAKIFMNEHFKEEWFETKKLSISALSPFIGFSQRWRWFLPLGASPLMGN